MPHEFIWPSLICAMERLSYLLVLLFLAATHGSNLMRVRQICNLLGNYYYFVWYDFVWPQVAYSDENDKCATTCVKRGTDRPICYLGWGSSNYTTCTLSPTSAILKLPMSLVNTPCTSFCSRMGYEYKWCVSWMVDWNTPNESSTRWIELLKTVNKINITFETFGKLIAIIMRMVLNCQSH